MEDIQIALSPLVQVMQSSGAKDFPVGRKPFSTHLDAAIDEAVPGLPEANVTLTLDDVSEVSDTPELAISTNAMAPPLDDAVLGHKEVGAISSAEPRQRVLDWSARGDTHASPHSDEVAETPISIQGKSADLRGSEGDRSSHNSNNMIMQKVRQAPLPLQVAMPYGLTGTAPKVTALPKNGQAAPAAMREVVGPDGTRAAPTPLVRSDDSAMSAPGGSSSVWADGFATSLEPAGGGKGLDRLPRGEDHASTPMQGIERTRLSWFRLPDATRPNVSSDKRGVGEARALQDGQVNGETLKTSVSLPPPPAPRPAVDGMVGGLLLYPRDTTEQPDKSGTMAAERDPPDVTGFLPVSGARGISMTPSATAPEISRQIAVQLADAMPQAIGREVEISLNPQELGRVRISLSTQDAGLNMTIMAERAETLDLMRRHIDQLAQEFRELGYGDVSFNFGQSGNERPQEDSQAVPGYSVAPDETGAATRTAASSPRPVATVTGLDLRI